MMKQGKYVGGYAPYGYVLHPSIRNKLAVDPEAADVIRRISARRWKAATPLRSPAA